LKPLDDEKINKEITPCYFYILKVFSKRIERGLKTHYSWWSRALRRTQKKVWLENARLKMVEGSKTHSKEKI
jgi:hypothetical protein